MKCKLANICDFAKQKIDVASLDISNYISTENMMPNKAGIADAATLPNVVQTQSFEKGDTLVSNIRPYFKKIWYASFEGGCSNDVLVFRAKTNVNPRFLYYVLADDTFFEYATSTAKGTKMPRGDKKAILEYEVPDISYKEQEKIANVLSALDDTIALNQQINKNLEEQTQAIFASYFITDNSFEKLKKLPLSDLCTTITKGTTPTTLGKPFVDSGINFIKAESILDNHSIDTAKFAFIDEDTHQQLKRSIIHNKDILFTIAGTLGRFAFVDNSVLPANTNQAVAIIRADAEKITPEYLYSFFIGNWHNDYYAKRIQQAVQANLSLTTIKSLPIPILPTDSMKKYLNVIIPIIAMIKHNENENRRLMSVRDALLPRLMSGEIDVSKIEI